MNNRLNLFNQIHKGLRAMLYNMALDIQQTDFSKEEEGKETLRRLRQVLELYSEHGMHEDEVVFPKVKQASPAAVEALEAEHEKDEQLTNDLYLQIRAYRWAPSAEERLTVGYSIHLAFQEFVAFNLQHMCKEERTINPLLWENYSDQELGLVQQEIVKNISPEKNIQYSRWMLKGANNAELNSWLEKVRNTAPAPVWEALKRLVMEELDAGRAAAILPHSVAQTVIY